VNSLLVLVDDNKLLLIMHLYLYPNIDVGGLVNRRVADDIPE